MRSEEYSLLTTYTMCDGAAPLRTASLPVLKQCIHNYPSTESRLYLKLVSVFVREHCTLSRVPMNSVWGRAAKNCTTCLMFQAFSGLKHERGKWNHLFDP